MIKNFIFLFTFSQLVFAQNISLKFEKIIGDMRGKGVNNLNVTVDKEGKIYLLMMNGRISIFDKDGKYEKSLSVKLPWPSYKCYLTLMGKRILLGDYKKDYPWVFDERRKGENPGEFKNPYCVVERAGKIYVSDSENKRIQIFSSGNTEKPEIILNMKTQPGPISVNENFIAIADNTRMLYLYKFDGKEFLPISSLKIEPGAVSIYLDKNNSIYVAYRSGWNNSLKKYVLENNKLKMGKVIATSYMKLWPNFYPARVPMVKDPDNNIWFASDTMGSILSLDPKTDRVKIRIKGIYRPVSVAFDKEEKIYAGTFVERDKKGPSIKVFSSDGKKVGIFGPEPLYIEKNVPIWGLLPDEDGGIYVRVVEQGWRKGWPAFTIKKVYADGKIKNFVDFGSMFAVRRKFHPSYAPYTLAFDSDKNIILVALPLVSALKISPEGKVIWEAGVKPQGGADKVDFSAPCDVTFDKNGNIWVIDREKNKIFCLSKEGKLLFQYGEYANIDDTEGKGFDKPTGIEIVSIEEKEYLYVGDSGNQRIVKYQIIQREEK